MRWGLKPIAESILCVAFLVMLSWHTVGQSLDPHWSTAWLWGWAGLLWLAARNGIRLVSVKAWALGLGVLATSFACGLQESPESLLIHGTCWTVLWTAPRKGCSWLNAMGRVAPWCAAAVLLGLLGFALYQGLSHGWGHQKSYQLPLPWAHRNVAFESLAFMTLLAARKGLKVRLVLWGLLVVAALVYQVRGVLLVGAAWGATMAWEQANNARWLFRAGAVAMGLFVLAQVAWNGLAVEDRVDLRAQLPDVVKTLDVLYNLKSATSSSERVQIWSWTLSNMQAVGGGSGSWKWAAEGFLQEQIGKCDVSIRRAHSDILQWLHELGWLPFALLTALAASRIWQARRFFLLAAPLLLFTFPSERAEIAVPMALVYWLLQRPKSEAAMEEPRHQAWLTTALASCLLFGGAWAVSQHALGKTVQGQVVLNGLTGFERRCIDAFPSDAAMNRIDVLLALQLNALGEKELATAMVCEVLEARPHSLAASKAWWAMQGGEQENPWDCSEFLRIRAKLPCPTTKDP